MICKIYRTEETDNPDGICDDCKFCIINVKNISFDFTLLSIAIAFKVLNLRGTKDG